MTELREYGPGAADPPFRHIEVAQVGGVIGAVVSGIQISGEVDAGAIGELRAALVRHRVVFLRDQHHATDAGQ